MNHPRLIFRYIRILNGNFFVLLALLLPTVSFSEEPYLNIETDPTPALILFQGKPKSTMHQTPTRLQISPTNFFRVKILRKGFESTGGYIGLKRIGGDSLDIYIFGTSRVSSLARSALFPGWGQRYTSQSRKGFWFGALSLSSAGYTGYLHYRYKSKNDDLVDAKNRWIETTPVLEKEKSWDVWADKYRESDRLYHQRNLWVGLTGYFYGVNLIDVLILAPMFSGKVKQPDKLFFKLPKKTPFKALLRSTLIPGWGQSYVGSPGKGWVYGALVGVGSYFAIDYYLEYKDDVTDFNLSQDYYHFLERQGRPVDELKDAFQAVEDRDRQADDSFRKFQWASGITIGIWVLNMIDMGFSYRSDEILKGQYFTSDDSTGKNDTKPRLIADIYGANARVFLKWHF
ncbi:MAG: hypothetical protein B6244_05860 [Candidatus Cloacimonetes bacterium 4572_55]|nr:MAG: hypothetical protein B6244_05860 [Candidatus Cloacimonetes bacterium 4572_55]